MNKKKIHRVLINRYRTSPILGADGSRGGERPSQADERMGETLKGGKVRGRRKRENSVPEGTKRRKGAFLRKSSRFEAVDEKRKKGANVCACVNAFRISEYVCTCACVSTSCVSIHEKRKEYL